MSVPEGGTATYAVRLVVGPDQQRDRHLDGRHRRHQHHRLRRRLADLHAGELATTQIVTLAAAEDTDTVNGSRTITVASSTSGITPVAVTATEADNDPTATQSLVVSTTALSVNEGGSATFSVRLNIAPTANVDRHVGGRHR